MLFTRWSTMRLFAIPLALRAQYADLVVQIQTTSGIVRDYTNLLADASG